MHDTNTIENRLAKAMEPSWDVFAVGGQSISGCDVSLALKKPTEHQIRKCVIVHNQERYKYKIFALLYNNS
jgi:hypothetical protein